VSVVTGESFETEKTVSTSWSLRSLKLSFEFARRELRGGIKGFRIFIACLALGVAGIAAVGSVSYSVVGALTDDAQAILGGDVTLRVVHRPATEDQRAYLRNEGDLVEMVTLRTMARAVGTDTEQRRLVELKAVGAGYPLYGTLNLSPQMDGAAALRRAPDDNGIERWGVALDPSLTELIGVSVGSVVKIGAVEYAVRALIDREPDRGGDAFSLGPRVLVSEESMPETGLLTLGSLFYHHYNLRLPPETDIGAWKDRINATFPDAGWRIRDFKDASPGVRQFVERITLFLTLVGLTALLVGGVGVSFAVTAYLNSKNRAIAALKCVGAPSSTIFQMFMVQILVLAGIAVVIGLVFGAVAPYFLISALSNALPVDLKLGLYAAPLTQAAIFGFLTAITFSLWPLFRTRDVAGSSLFRDTVQPIHSRPKVKDIMWIALSGLALGGFAIATAADRPLAAGFVAGSVITFVAFRAASWLVMRVAGWLSGFRPVVSGRPGLRLALANLHRPGAMTGSVVMSMGLGLTVLVAIALIQGNLAREVQDNLPDRAPSFFFIDIQLNQVDTFSGIVTRLVSADAAQTTPMVRGRITEIKGIPAAEAEIDPEEAWALRGDRGLTYASVPPENATIVQGEWWPADYSGKPLISMDDEMARGFGMELGDALTLNILGRDVTVTLANTRRIDWSTLQMNFSFIFAPGFLESAPHTRIAAVKAPEEVENDLFREITDTLPNVSAIPVREALETVNSVLSHIGTATRVTAAVTLIAGTLVLAGAIAAGHKRRVYDAVVLKVLGATRRNVIASFLMEYGLLGLVTGLIAGAVGTLAAWTMVTVVMQGEWVFLPTVLLSTIGICTAITLAGGLIGTWRALGQPSAPLLRND